MAKMNITDDGNRNLFEQMICSATLSGGIHSQLKGLSVLNSFLSVTAFLGNTLILVALHKDSSLHPPSKLLFRSLATTDLCVGIIAEPLMVTYWMSLVNERWNTCRYPFLATFITSSILGSVSLLTLTAISVDRLLALLLGLRYRQVVTLKRSYLTVTVIWVVSIIGTTMHFLNYLISAWYTYIGISLCLVTSLFSYTKIFFTLRHHQLQVQDHIPQGPQGQPSPTIPLNIPRYRKAVYSALWVQLTLVICYLPHGIVGALISRTGPIPSLYLARQCALTLVFLNSSLNPMLYCWKIREVRQAVKDTIRHLCCSSS